MKKPATSDPKKRKGLIIVNTGDGKGKSTASFGLALRAAGNKMNVFIMQFMKGPWKAGERKALNELSEYKSKDPTLNIEQVHFFPIGGIKQTTDWLEEVLND